jgi:hypothetical protein
VSGENVFHEPEEVLGAANDDTGDHLELNETLVLNDNGYKKYQRLARMLNWIVMIGSLYVCHVVTSSLARFTACYCKGHLERAKQAYGYLKKWPNMHTMVN